MFTNYHDSVLDYVASIRKYFDLDSAYEPNRAFSEYLNERKPKQIILFLVDGMGSRLIERKLSQDSFLRRNMFAETATVFPPTTTAATTAILNGRSPNMNGWLGWNQYFKEVNDTIIPFLGKGSYSRKNYGSNYAWEKIPTPNIIDELKERGISSHDIFPSFRKDGCKTVEAMVERIIEESHNCSDPFIYAYWDFYDEIMHNYGPDGELPNQYLKSMDQLFESFSELNPETLLIILADHGQVEITKQIDVCQTELNQYLRMPIGLEPRACAFYLKPGVNEVFEQTFKALYADEFILLSAKQVIDSHLFGDYQNHERFEELIGDYLAIAKAHSVFIYNYHGEGLINKGHHAGSLEDERMIPIITYMK